MMLRGRRKGERWTELIAEKRSLEDWGQGFSVKVAGLYEGCGVVVVTWRDCAFEELEEEGEGERCFGELVNSGAVSDIVHWYCSWGDVQEASFCDKGTARGAVVNLAGDSRWDNARREDETGEWVC
jgi:hypothetical protein